MLESLSKGNQSVMRGKAVATRLRLLGSDDPNSRNERAEGLCGACASDTPSGDGTLGCVRTASIAGASEATLHTPFVLGWQRCG